MAGTAGRQPRRRGARVGRAGGGGRRWRRNALDGRGNCAADALQALSRAEVILLGKRIASAVSGLARGLDRGAQRRCARRGRMRVLGRLQADRGDGDCRGRIGQQSFGVAAHRRAFVGGAFGSGLRALAAVECVIEREAVVALADGVLRPARASTAP